MVLLMVADVVRLSQVTHAGLAARDPTCHPPLQRYLATLWKYLWMDVDHWSSKKDLLSDHTIAFVVLLVLSDLYFGWW